MLAKQEILDHVKNLNTAKSGDKRYPHKPLLLLVAIKKLKDGEREISFDEVRKIMTPLLDVFAPPVVSHNVDNPYWRLQQDGLWNVQGSRVEDYNASTPPKTSNLRNTTGNLIPELIDYLVDDPAFSDEIIQAVLHTYFSETLFEELLSSIGLDLVPDAVSEPSVVQPTRTRDPSFRPRVLQAYEYRCAVTGFQAALGKSYFGCEAAHVRWHAYDGPDLIENGISLEPTMHKLFDVGAWALTDDRRVIVSADFTGSDYALEKLRSLHGKSISAPAPGNSLLGEKYIRWHREADQGGIFRTPGLPL